MRSPAPGGSTRTINDPSSGSQYIPITGVNEAPGHPVPTTVNPVALAGGVDPALPDATALIGSAQLQLSKVEGPIILNIVGYLTDVSKIDTAEAASTGSAPRCRRQTCPDRQDIFIINDNAPPRLPGQSSSSYKTLIQTPLSGPTWVTATRPPTAPWIIIPNPQRLGRRSPSRRVER